MTSNLSLWISPGAPVIPSKKVFQEGPVIPSEEVRLSRQVVCTPTPSGLLHALLSPEPRPQAKIQEVDSEENVLGHFEGIVLSWTYQTPVANLADLKPGLVGFH